MTKDEFSDISNEINALLQKVNRSALQAESVRDKTWMFQVDIGFPMTLRQPLYPLSIAATSCDINALKNKIHNAVEIGDLMHALALQSQLIATLYLSDNSFSCITISAISDLADIYYSRKLYDQAGIHSSTILKHISRVSQLDQVFEIKAKSIFLLARAKISQNMLKKANELLNTGMIIMRNHDISTGRLQALFLGIQGELCELQGLDLSAIEAYAELIEKNLYKDKRHHIEILIKLYHISRKIGEDEKALEYLEKADSCYKDAILKDISTFLNLKYLLIQELSKDQPIHAVELADKTLCSLGDQKLCIDQRKKELAIRVYIFLFNCSIY